MYECMLKPFPHSCLPISKVQVTVSDPGYWPTRITSSDTSAVTDIDSPRHIHNEIHTSIHKYIHTYIDEYIHGDGTPMLESAA